MPIKLRDYQEASLQKAHKYLFEKDGPSGLWHLATGLGKTVLTTHFVDRYNNPHDQKNRTIVVGGVNNTLSFQMYEAFVRDFPYMKGAVGWQGKATKALGLVMNDYNEIEARTVIASIQTLMSGTNELGSAKKPPEMEPIERRDFTVTKYGTIHLSVKSKRRWLVSPRMDALLAAGGLFTLWIHDEAHHSVADGSVLLINRLHELDRLLDRPTMKVIGNTATPARSDKRGLHTLYSTIFTSYPIDYGQRHGYLVPFATPQRILVDLVEKDSAGNDTGVFEERTTVRFTENWDEIIARGWLDKGEGRPTFCYVSEHNGRGAVEDSIKLTRTMQDMGIRAAHVDGTGCIGPDGADLPKEAQRTLLKMMQHGELDVICNYNVLVEGVDVTRVSCILNARRISDKNPVTLTQMLGRGLRPNPESGKKDLLVIDATGDPYVLNGIAELSGYKVVPGEGKFTEDFDIESIFREFVRLCNEQGDKVAQWQGRQTRYAIATIQEAMDFAFKLDKDHVQTSHLRALSECIAWCQDEDKLLEGIDSRDLRVGSNVHGVNQSYDIIKITQKSKASWYGNEESALMSLSVSKGRSFVLHPPHHTRARLAKEALELLQSSSSNILTEGKSSDAIENGIRFMKKAIELFTNFTLWSVDTSKVWDTQIPQDLVQEQRFWLRADEGLDVLEDFAFGYARDHIEDYVASFAEKKNRKSWQDDPQEEKQIKLYKSLTGGQEPNKDWNKGELSHRINHIAATKPVERLVANFETQIDRLKEVL